MTQSTPIRRVPGHRPRLLGLFSCARGTAMGYTQFIGRAYLARLAAPAGGRAAA